MIRRSVLPVRLAALLLLAFGLGGARPADAVEPTLHLSWNAPAGFPRAASSLRTTCADTARVDTLWLTFDPGESAGKFYGVYARLYFHPVGGDTLGPFWHFKSGTANQRNLTIEFGGEDFPLAPAWTAPGMGQPLYEFNGSAGTLDLVYAVADASAGPIEGGRRYAFARVMIRQRRADLAGCRQPMCIEWALGRVGAGRDDRHSRTGDRFVTWNAAGAACAPWRTDKPAPWTPKANRAPGRAPAAPDSQ